MGYFQVSWYRPTEKDRKENYKGLVDKQSLSWEDR
uniref:Uncharacterized protein n=1 Tax=Rhizophora mucronata TaxID=61149 RepID=A0A2P2MXU8_RHIMU